MLYLLVESVHAVVLSFFPLFLFEVVSGLTQCKTRGNKKERFLCSVEIYSFSMLPLHPDKLSVIFISSDYFLHITPKPSHMT